MCGGDWTQLVEGLGDGSRGMGGDRVGVKRGVGECR